MPIFSIETPGGRVLDIEAADQATALRGAQEWHAANPGPKDAVGHLAAAVTDIPAEIGAAATEAVGTVNAGLNPFSDARKERMERAAQKPFWDFSETLGGVADTGKALLGIPAAVSSPITGASRSVVGHGMAATGLMDYEQGKAAADTATMAAAPRGASPKGVRTQAQPLPTSEQLLDSYKAKIAQPEVQNLKIDPYSTDLLASKIDMDLRSAGFRPTKASGTFSALDELRPAQGVRAASVADVDNARQALGVVAKERDAFGKATPDAAAAQKALRQIDDYFDRIGPTDIIAGDAAAANATMRSARADYAAGKRSGEIDFRLNKAERQAGKNGAGMNVENSLRQKIDQVSDYGMAPAEVALKDKIVLGDVPRNALRTAGKMGVDGGLSLLLNMGAAGMTGGLSIPFTVAGTAARMAGQRITKAQIKQLNEMIRARSPLAQSLPHVPVPLPGGLLSALYPGVLPQGMGLLSAIPETVRDRR